MKFVEIPLKSFEPIKLLKLFKNIENDQNSIQLTCLKFCKNDFNN